ncbi:MAG TPA: zinc ribbon domain-containing protein [Steroidobacteraceae bacterium]|nr:zinc ribbon domain-containing protein [Steroidobacteraceae bacterium]
MQKGEYVWGRNKWNRSHSDSAIRTRVTAEAPPKVVKMKRLEIVDPALWERVRKIQTARTTARINISKGIKKKRERGDGVGRGRRPGYWLSSVLVCGECGANFIGNGLRDYVCANVRVHACKNGVRFLRDEVEQKVYELLRAKLYDKRAIADAQAEFRRLVDDFEKSRQSVPGTVTVDMRQFNSEIEAMNQLARAGKLSGETAQTFIEQIELRRRVAVEQAAEKGTKVAQRALKVADALPEFMKKYASRVQHALKVFSDAAYVHEAREATRDQIEGGMIKLSPTTDRKALKGVVRLKGLGGFMLQTAPVLKTAGKAGRGLNGSGGRI